MAELEGLVDVAGTARWRRSKAHQFPEDARNAQAAEMLEHLALGIAPLEGSPLHHELHRAIDSAALDTRHEADLVSEHLRSVGFGYKPDSTQQLLSDLLSSLR